MTRKLQVTLEIDQEVFEDMEEGDLHDFDPTDLVEQLEKAVKLGNYKLLD